MTPSDFTVGSLEIMLTRILDEFEKRIDIQFKAQEKSINAALTATDKALTKAETAIEKRLEGMNEFRNALSDQTKHFVTRAELEKVESNIDLRLDNIAQDVDEIKSKGDTDTGRKMGIASIVGLIGYFVGPIIGALIALFT